MNVVPFPGPSSVTPTIVETLEALLEKAREGELENFMFVGIMRDGGALSARSCEPTSPRYALIGAIENRLRVLHQLLDAEGTAETVFSPEAG